VSQLALPLRALPLPALPPPGPPGQPLPLTSPAAPATPAFLEPPPAPPGTPLDRAIGAFLGLAVGDALGATLEFTIRDTQPLHTELTGGGVFGWPPGCWTDDTSMALCLADTLLKHGGVDPVHLMHRFLDWRSGGENSPVGYCFDIGTITADALDRYNRGAPPYAGSPDPATAGNGSLVRVAPVAILHHRSVSLAMRDAQLQSLTTHGAAECLDACAFVAMLLVEAINGEGKEAVLRARTWAGSPAVTALASGSWRGRAREEIRSTGYVIDTLEAALWAVGRSSTPEEALITAVNLAGDADSVGAVTGQLAGALWGASAIPPRWLTGLAWRRALKCRAATLFDLGAKGRS
jgi:ADP-ribosyl-[dinitrogen reductase] hydrolase